MNIEEEIFKNSDIIIKKLIPIGFKKLDNCYIITKNILDNTFKIEVTITKDKKVIGKVYDLEFMEEYTNFRLESNSGFSSKVKSEFVKFLKYLKDNITLSKLFISAQANRICSLISREFNGNVEFLWKNSNAGVFRNNGKWYALFMDINKSILDGEDKYVEVLNIKLDKEEVAYLLKKKGFYKAYHMNKESWITIILDDTLKDTEILGLIRKSYMFTL